MLFVRKSVALGVLGGGTHRVAFDYFHNTFIAWKSPGRQISTTTVGIESGSIGTPAAAYSLQAKMYLS